MVCQHENINFEHAEAHRNNSASWNTRILATWWMVHESQGFSWLVYSVLKGMKFWSLQEVCSALMSFILWNSTPSCFIHLQR